MSYQLMRIGVEGVGQGLLMHNPAGMAPASTTTQRAGKKIPMPHDEAVAGLYVLPGGKQLYASADWFREAALIGAKEVKDTTRRGNATMVQRFGASVFLSDPYCALVRASDGTPITSADSDWEMFLKRVVIQGNGIVRARPLIHDWACEVEFEYDDETIIPAMAAEILHLAGKFPGVGDYRPGKKGPYGRFRVVTLNGEEWSK
jgi:hypothetical protein